MYRQRASHFAKNINVSDAKLRARHVIPKQGRYMYGYDERVVNFEVGRLLFALTVITPVPFGRCDVSAIYNA